MSWHSRREPPHGVTTPWHDVLDPRTPGGGPTAPVVLDRLQSQNPAILELMVQASDLWDDFLAACIDANATDDDIWRGGWADLLGPLIRRYLTVRLGELRSESAARTGRSPIATSQGWGRANQANVDRGVRHATLARELKLQGYSAAEIGRRVGADEKRPPYDPRTVRKWLAQNPK